jgi:hypothetical protein
MLRDGRVIMKSISQNGNSMAEFEYNGGDAPASIIIIKQTVLISVKNVSLFIPPKIPCTNE